jgi:hypothetical protein
VTTAFGVASSIAGGELVGGEAAEDHRVHGAEARAGKHGHRRLRDHGHVDDDAVAPLDAELGEGAGEAGHAIGELRVGELLDLAGHGAVVHERELLTEARLDVAVEAVVRGVEAPSREPSVERCAGVIEHLLGCRVPVDVLRRFTPEPFGVLHGACVHLGQTARSRVCHEGGGRHDVLCSQQVSERIGGRGIRPWGVGVGGIRPGLGPGGGVGGDPTEVGAGACVASANPESFGDAAVRRRAGPNPPPGGP